MGILVALRKNIRLDRKNMSLTNDLAYSTRMVMKKRELNTVCDWGRSSL